MATDLAVAEPQAALGPVLPLATPEAMMAAMRAYEALKRAVLTENDEQEIVVKGKKRKFTKRSGWRRLSIAFGVSTSILDRKITVGPEGRTLSAEFTVRATAPNGRFADGWGACSAWEDRFQDERGRQKMEHDIPATAETRAENRASSNLFGYGEVSAEEMEDSPGVAKPTCPNCGKFVRASTFKEGEWYCWKQQGGCGWKGTNPIQGDEIPTDKASPQTVSALQEAQGVGSLVAPSDSPPPWQEAESKVKEKLKRGRPKKAEAHQASFDDPGRELYLVALRAQAREAAAALYVQTALRKGLPEPAREPNSDSDAALTLLIARPGAYPDLPRLNANKLEELDEQSLANVIRWLERRAGRSD